MENDEPKTLSRDCEAVLIPSGEKLALAAGGRVWVTQSLGGSYTVMTEHGQMARIAERDADALGVRGAAGSLRETAQAGGAADVEKLVWDRLKTCFDPEIPVNIVDLGLIYGCRVTPLGARENRVEVRFTLTARGCGMGEVLKADIRTKILAVPAVKEVDVQLVWDPPWNQSMMSGTAKVRLGMV